MKLIGLVTFIVAFIITIISVLLIKKLAIILHFVDEPGDRKVHKQPIPLGGGIALFLGIFVTLFLAIISTSIIKIYQPAWLPETIYKYLPGVSIMLPKLAIIFIGGMLMFLVGLIDDIWGLKPSFKLLGQLIVAIYLVFLISV